jgi:hypothetical protein
MLDDVVGYMKGHKHLVVLTCVLLAAFVVFSVWRYQALHSVPAAEEVPPEQAVEEEPADPAVELTEEQRLMAASYTGDTLDVVALLEASLWATDSEEANVTFADNVLTERSAGRSRSAVFIVLNAEKVQGDSHEVKQEGYIADIEVEGGTYFLRLERTLDTKSTEAAPIEYTGWTVTCDAFEFSKAYTRNTAVGTFSITGLDDDAVKLIGGDIAAIEAQMHEYCADFYPTASEAAWDGKVEVDYSAGTATTRFYLNNKGSTPLTVAYDMATGKHVFGRSA